MEPSARAAAHRLFWMERHMARICIVDDKDVMRDSLTDTLVARGHEVTAFSDPQQAAREIRPASYDAIVSDLKMPGMDGIEFLRALRARGVDTPFVLMTAYATVSTAVEAMKMGAMDYIQKPFEGDAIAIVLQRAVAMGRLRGENEALRVTLRDLEGDPQMIGSGRALRQVRTQLERVAKSQATVPRNDGSLTHFASPRGEKSELVSQRLPGLENVLHPLLSFLFSAKTQESFAFEVEQVLF